MVHLILATYVHPHFLSSDWPWAQFRNELWKSSFQAYSEQNVCRSQKFIYVLLEKYILDGFIHYSGSRDSIHSKNVQLYIYCTEHSMEHKRSAKSPYIKYWNYQDRSPWYNHIQWLESQKPQILRTRIGT